MVRRRPPQRFGELPRPAPGWPAAQQGRHHLGRRAGRQPDLDLPTAPLRGLPFRQRAQNPRRGVRATASPSTCRWSPRPRWRCWPARASARRTAWSSAASRPRLCATAINDAQAKVVITADGGCGAARSLKLKEAVDAALRLPQRREGRGGQTRRAGHRLEWAERDIWWHDGRGGASGVARSAG